MKFLILGATGMRMPGRRKEPLTSWQRIYWYLRLMRTIEKQIDIEVISSLLSSIQVNTLVDFGSSDN